MKVIATFAAIIKLITAYLLTIFERIHSATYLATIISHRAINVN